MTRDLHTAELQRGFDFFDLDHGNGIDENDFAVMAHRVARSQGHDEGSPAAQRIRERYLALWTDGLAVVAPPGTVSLGRDECVSAIFPDLSDDDIDTAFAHLDTDGDGVLSAEEFVGAIVGYWTGTDPESPANWWLGPPAD